MLIPLQFLVAKYKPKFKGVIHVGAHWAEEHADYVKAGITHFAYYEPCKDAYNIIQRRFWEIENIWCSNFAVGAQEKEVVMNTASFNKGESNSILQPHLHLQQHPEVIFDGQETAMMVSLDFHFTSANTDLKKIFNFLVMDVQGYEGEVLKGATETLKHIDYVYTEVNKGETYAGNALIEEIDLLLKDFQRVETKWAGNTTWGDSFYIRKTLL